MNKFCAKEFSALSPLQKDVLSASGVQPVKESILSTNTRKELEITNLEEVVVGGFNPPINSHELHPLPPEEKIGTNVESFRPKSLRKMIKSDDGKAHQTAPEADCEISSKKLSKRTLEKIQKKATGKKVTSDTYALAEEDIESMLDDLTYKTTSDYSQEPRFNKLLNEPVNLPVLFKEMEASTIKNCLKFFGNKFSEFLNQKKIYVNLKNLLDSLEKWNALFDTQERAHYTGNFGKELENLKKYSCHELLELYLGFLREFNRMSIWGSNIECSQKKAAYELIMRIQGHAGNIMDEILTLCERYQVEIIAFRIEKVSRTSTEFWFRTDSRRIDRTIHTALSMTLKSSTIKDTEEEKPPEDLTQGMSPNGSEDQNCNEKNPLFEITLNNQPGMMSNEDSNGDEIANASQLSIDEKECLENIISGSESNEPAGGNAVQSERSQLEEEFGGSNTFECARGIDFPKITSECSNQYDSLKEMGNQIIYNA